MKKMIFMALSALALLNVSCNRDGDDNPIERNRKKLINNYLNDKKYEIIRETIEYKLKTEVKNYVFDDCISKSRMEFYADNVGSNKEYFKINDNCYNRVNNFTWKVDNVNRIYAYYNETVVYYISKMENNYLTLSYSEDIDGDGEEERVILEMKQVSE